MSVEEHLPESASRLDLKLLQEIANVTPSPLVLHGGSGIHPDRFAGKLQNERSKGQRTARSIRRGPDLLQIGNSACS